MFDFPSTTEIFTTISAIVSILVVIILALTGYGWNSLYFLLLPVGICFIGLALRGIFGRFD